MEHPNNFKPAFIATLLLSLSIISLLSFQFLKLKQSVNYTQKQNQIQNDKEGAIET